jgi:hypothetical protein
MFSSATLVRQIFLSINGKWMYPRRYVTSDTVNEKASHESELSLACSPTRGSRTCSTFAASSCTFMWKMALNYDELNIFYKE